MTYSLFFNVFFNFVGPQSSFLSGTSNFCASQANPFSIEQGQNPCGVSPLVSVSEGVYLNCAPQDGATNINQSYLPNSAVNKHPLMRSISSNIPLTANYQWESEAPVGSESNFSLSPNLRYDENGTNAADEMLSNLRRFNSPSSFTIRNQPVKDINKATKPNQIVLTPQPLTKGQTELSRGDLSNISPSRSLVNDSDPQEMFCDSLNPDPFTVNPSSAIYPPVSLSLTKQAQNSNSNLLTNEDTSLDNVTLSGFETALNADELYGGSEFSQFDKNVKHENLMLNSESTQSPNFQTSSYLLSGRSLQNSHFEKESSVSGSDHLKSSESVDWCSENSSLNTSSSLGVSAQTHNFPTVSDIQNLQLTNEDLNGLMQDLPMFTKDFHEQTLDGYVPAEPDINLFLNTSEAMNISCEPLSSIHYEANPGKTGGVLTQRTLSKPSRHAESPPDLLSTISPAESGYDSAEFGSVKSDGLSQVGS